MRRPNPAPLVIALISIGLLSGCGSTATTVTSTEAAPTSTVVSSSAKSSSSTPHAQRAALRHCDQNIRANSRASCGFAENVFKAFAEGYQSSGGTAPSSVDATSPSTGQSYTMSCDTSSPTIKCSGGVSAEVVFPMRAVQVYGPVSPSSTTASQPPPTSTPAPPATPTGCYPLTNAGNCYQPGPILPQRRPREQRRGR